MRLFMYVPLCMYARGLSILYVCFGTLPSFLRGLPGQSNYSVAFGCVGDDAPWAGGRIYIDVYV